MNLATESKSAWSLLSVCWNVVLATISASLKFGYRITLRHTEKYKNESERERERERDRQRERKREREREGERESEGEREREM